MEENKNNEERKIVSDLGMPIDPKSDFSMPTTSADSGSTTSFKPKSAETRKQNKAISGLGEGQTATTGKLESSTPAPVPEKEPVEETVSEENLTPEEKKIAQKNVEYNNLRKKLLPIIKRTLEREGGKWDKRAIANAEKTVSDEFKRQSIQKEASAFGEETQKNEEARAAREQDLYDKSLAILNDPEVDKESAAYFNAQKIVDEAGHDKEVDKLISENPGMTRKTAEEYLEQKSKKEADAKKQAEIEQKFQENLELERKANEGLKKDYQNIIDSNPEGSSLREWATDELDRMNQMDEIKATLKANGIPENSPIFQKYAEKEMKIYNKMKELSKMQDKAAANKAAALEKEKKARRKFILQMASGISAPWVKLIASVIAMSAFGII